MAADFIEFILITLSFIVLTKFKQDCFMKFYFCYDFVHCDGL